MLQWEGDFKHLGFDGGWSTPTLLAMILGSWGSEFSISKSVLTPV